MFIFTCNHYLGFPETEYGGLFVMAAHDETECAELLYNQMSKYELLSYLELDSLDNHSVKEIIDMSILKLLKDIRFCKIGKANENIVRPSILEQFTT